MTRYIFQGTRLHRPGGDIVERGDVMEPTESELRAFRDLLEPVEEAEQPTPNEPPAESAGRTHSGDEPVPGYDDMSVSDLREGVTGFDDTDVRAAVEYERANADRKTALEVLEGEAEARDIALDDGE